MANSANFGILTPRGDPWRQDAAESEGTKGHRASREFVREGQRLDCFASALIRPGREVHFGHFLSKSQDWLKEPIFSPKLLWDNCGAICPVQRGPVITGAWGATVG